MTFSVRYSAAARADLDRLYDHLLERSATLEDLGLADQALETLDRAIGNLMLSPFIYRKVGSSTFLREMLVPFGRSGYVALYEIDDATTVTILAVRHQLEDDYH